MHRTLRLVCSLLLSILIASSAVAGSLCDSEYDAVMLAFSDARLPQGTQQKLVTKVRNARRLARGSGPSSRANALKELDEAVKLLDGNATKDVSPEARASLRAAIAAYSGCLSSSPVPQDVKMTLRVQQVGAEPGITVSAGGNIEIRVDGEPVTKTKPDGTATVTVAAGEHSFAAVAAADYGVFTILEVTPATTTLDLIMNGGGDYAVRANLQVDELADSILQPSSLSFTARFLDAEGNTIKLKSLLRVELTSTGGELTDLRPSFTFKNSGEMTATNAAALRQILGDRFGPYELAVTASDNDRVYRNKVRFDLGRFRTAGSVTSPPRLTVPLGGIPVRLTNDRSGFVFWGTTAANGSLAFPALMPEGVYLVRCETVYQSIRYFCADAFVLDADRNFSLRLFALAGPAAEPIAASASTNGQ